MMRLRERKTAEKRWPQNFGTRKAYGCLRKREKARCLQEWISVSRSFTAPWKGSGTKGSRSSFNRMVDSCYKKESLTFLCSQATAWQKVHSLEGCPDWKHQKQQLSGDWLSLHSEWWAPSLFPTWSEDATTKDIYSPPHTLTATLTHSEEFVRFLSEEVDHPREMTVGTVESNNKME